jgi:hypothetical protein
MGERGQDHAGLWLAEDQAMFHMTAAPAVIVIYFKSILLFQVLATIVVTPKQRKVKERRHVVKNNKKHFWKESDHWPATRTRPCRLQKLLIQAF